MNLTICLSAAFLILSHAAFCMPIRGQVKAGNKGLSHVVITDGINFTQTDTKGNFLLDTDQEARFVYLLTPDGYVADYRSGTPEFYLPLDPEKEDYIFQLTETGKRSHHILLAIADVQTKTDEQFQRFQTQSIPDLQEMIASYPPATPVTGISLGDIVWDHFEHFPFYYADRGIIPGGEELFGILKNHPVSLISGHTHLNSNHEIKPGIIEHNIGAICGTWWTADENRDGTPNGYDVFEITGSEIEWFYKSVGHERNWQFKVFPRGTVKEKPNSVIAKVWNWDKKWQVKWYEDGAAKGAMQRFNGYDPDYLEYVGRLKTEKYTQPQESFFYFEATPSEKAREIEIEVTDRFGHIFPRQKVVLLPDK